MTHEILSNFWFLALTLVWSVYIVQDAFITGGSMLSIVYKDDEKTYKHINNILALQWDGIQVWLILAVGGMFAAFPSVYATTLSALYTPFFLLLYAIILRGIAIEVIYKTDSKKLQNILKYTLTISSFLITLVIGVYLMNTFIGLPISSEGYNTGFFSFLSLFNVIAIIGALMFISVAITQGVNYIRLNTSKDFAPKMYKSAKVTAITFPFCMVIVFLAFANNLNVFNRGLFAEQQILWILPTVALIFAILASLLFLKEKHGLSFILNIIAMISFVFTGFISMMPYAIVSTIDPAYGMKIIDGAAGVATLEIMLGALIIFLPIVLAYQTFKYIKFWGKV